ncbi:hypothetical protein AVEN_177002-1 [Araneus ventricosus]|uniref:MADF domain-containing protein n=1 Tax=Araneus ventricosus TaxID=182803 RepID=A0A4Y2PPE6_ARAVE|nr:hypothetical protein AVEN_177002-1 [Araneus ventricosus]
MDSNFSLESSGKAVIKRWGNLRDSFSRYQKKLKECKKSGSGSVSLKKYIYNDQLHFLAHIYNLRETDDSLECAANREEVLSDNEFLQLNNVTTEEKKTERCANRKRRKPDEIELKMLKALEQPETQNPHMAFFQGVVPHLNKFDDGEILEFQMAVLQTIANMKEKRKRIQTPAVPYHPQHFAVPYQQQSSSIRNLQPSFNPPLSNFQPSFPQNPQFFNLQNNRNLCESEPITAQQYLPNFGQIFSTNSVDNQPADVASPVQSESSQNTIDFNICSV